MKDKDLEIILKKFTMYSDKEYIEFLCPERQAKWYYHNMWEFHIIVFDDNSVYQLGTEAETIGVELKTLKDFEIRYKSFIGRKFMNDVKKKPKKYILKKYERFEIIGRGSVLTVHRDENDVEGIKNGSIVVTENDEKEYIVTGIEMFRNTFGIGKNIGLLVKENS